jgi:transglutaminase-like putative cysteine protease
VSVRTGNAGDGAVAGDAGGSRYVGLRDPALLGVLLLTASYVSVLYHVTDVVGGSERFALVVGGVFLLATLLGRVLRFRAAVLVTAVLVGAGFVAYYLSVPVSNRALFTTARVVEDAVALLTGLSVLRLTRAGVWALAIAPGPVFLSWYLALRERYVKSVGVGGAALFFFVLTGDAGPLVTLAGVVGSAVAVGLGTLGEVGAVAEQWDTVAVVVAAMVVLSASISVVPGGAAQPLLEDRGAPTVDGSLSGGSEGIQVLGSIRLSPAVKFTVESDEARYWGTAAYDRYTGSGWMPTGEREPYDGRLPGPPGESRIVTQRFTAKDRLNAVPSAWKPVSAEGAIGPSPDVTPQGYLRPTDGIGSNRSVTVVSEVPQYRRADLREAGDDYPRRIREAYLQLPESTSERVAERAAEVTADADNAHDAAAAIERYLERNKQYSLTVDRPEGNVADAFLFEMQSGYCTYYATTMVVMLRTQGVPARLVTGYTSGQQVGDDEYVVRGLDSHAWVQVYFPDVGWVNFDPTPAGPRQAAEDARVEEARQNGEANVDAAGSGTTTTPTTDTPEQGSDSNGTSLPNVTTAAPTNGSNATVDGTPAAPSGILNAEPAAAANGTTGDGGFLPDSPSREQTGVGLALLVGSIAAGRRFGVFGRAYRTLRLYRQGARTEPTADIERAFDRLERLLARQYRERRPGETPREYLQALHNVGLDDRALEIGRLYERAHYGSAVDRTDADRAISTVDSLVWERTPVLGRLLRRS